MTDSKFFALKNWY